MISNPITDEIRAIRHQLAAEQDNDISRIGNELRRRQAISGRRVVRLSPRSPETQATNQTMQRSGGGDVSGNGESTPAAR